MKNTSQPLIDRLISGEKVICLNCKIGIYKPLNPSADFNHYYICNKCGDIVHFDPVVNIE